MFIHTNGGVLDADYDTRSRFFSKAVLVMQGARLGSAWCAAKCDRTVILRAEPRDLSMKHPHWAKFICGYSFETKQQENKSSIRTIPYPDLQGFKNVRFVFEVTSAAVRAAALELHNGGKLSEVFFSAKYFYDRLVICYMFGGQPFDTMSGDALTYLAGLEDRAVQITPYPDTDKVCVELYLPIVLDVLPLPHDHTVSFFLDFEGLSGLKITRPELHLDYATGPHLQLDEFSMVQTQPHEVVLRPSKVRKIPDSLKNTRGCLDLDFGENWEETDGLNFNHPLLYMGVRFTKDLICDGAGDDDDSCIHPLEIRLIGNKFLTLMTWKNPQQFMTSDGLYVLPMMEDEMIKTRNPKGIEFNCSRVDNLELLIRWPSEATGLKKASMFVRSFQLTKMCEGMLGLYYSK